MITDRELSLTRAEVCKLAGIAARTLRLHEQQGKISFKDRRVSLASFNRYAAKYHPRLRALTIEQVYESRERSN